jgi:hypothetical protein
MVRLGPHVSYSNRGTERAGRSSLPPMGKTEETAATTAELPAPGMEALPAPRTRRGRTAVPERNHRWPRRGLWWLVMARPRQQAAAMAADRWQRSPVRVKAEEEVLRVRRGVAKVVRQFIRVDGDRGREIAVAAQSLAVGHGGGALRCACCGQSEASTSAWRG